MPPTSGDIERSTAGKWIGLVAAGSGLFLASLDITVNVALPDIRQSFETDVRTIQWIIIFYVGSTTGLQLGLGSAADNSGLKRFYILGLGVYTLAVMLISLATSLPMLFGLRVVQAVGNGLILASAPALVTGAFPREERGSALGLMAGIATLGTVAASLGGGLLVDGFGWRAIFIARVPLGAVTILLAYVYLRERAAAESRPAFDLRGAITLFTGLASFILFLTLGGRIGWTALSVALLLVLAAASLGAFVHVENRVPRPVLDLGLLRHRVLSVAVLSSYLMFLATFVNLFILPFYVSDTLGVDATLLGFLLMLTPMASAVSAPLGGWLSDRIAPAYICTIGLGVVAVVMFWFSALEADSTVPEVALRMGAIGFGMGLFWAANANLIMSSVPGTRLGTGAAILALSRSMGVVTSVAVMSVLLAAFVSSHAESLASQGVTGGAADARAFVLAFRDTYRISGVLATAATVVSLAYWPPLLRGRIS
jgi:EmrB/QacA subfamily drug resistance transporter